MASGTMADIKKTQDKGQTDWGDNIQAHLVEAGWLSGLRR